MANNVVTVASLNFDAIRESLKDYMRTQPTFTDFDYEASSMSMIIDLLAYNTYQNSFYLNMIGNEMFLDSAQLRNSVVSRAKMLGYTPRSARGATATLDVTVTPDDSPSSVIIAKNTAFSSTIDSVTYKFVLASAHSITADSDGLFSSTITITEGEPLTHRFTVSTSDPVDYIIPNKFVDTTSLVVQVQTSASNTSYNTFILADDITQVQSNTRVYFLQENVNERYQLQFGDGVIGAPLIDGNIVNIQYRVCHGSILNGANNFISPSSLGGYSTFTAVLNTSAVGGANAESVSSVKFSAPLNYETQNRGVTASDYKRLILRDNGDIQAVSVWGGEENDPPIYGKVYISVKPTTGSLISIERKDSLIRYLEDYNVMSIDPVFVDATYIYITPSIEVRYDDDTTNLAASDISALIETVISNYETDHLGLFSGKFRYSEFFIAINNTDPSIVSTLIELIVQKRFVPITTAATTYKLAFNNQLEPETGDAITSSAFTYEGTDECYFDDNGTGTVRIYILGDDGTKSYLNSLAGTVNYTTGLVILDSILLDAYEGDEIQIFGELIKNDVTGLRNQLILIADASISVYNDNTGVLESTVDLETSGTITTTNSSGINTVII